MRKLLLIIGLIFGFWLFMSPSGFAQTLGDARLSLIQGEVVMQNQDTGSEWGAASINMPLTPGTKIWVPENGRMETQFIGGSYLRAGADTEVDFADLKIGGEDNILQVGVPQGRIYVSYTGSNVENSVFQVDSPIISARAYEPSKFKVDVYEDSYTEVSVMNGSVYVEGQNGETKVNAGSMLSIGTDQRAEISPMRLADSWDRWNQSRDSAFAQGGPGRKYLPGVLSVYSSDFDTYGHWVNTADYGYVWTPHDTPVDWAPYRIGRWCWVGGDYVWVSHEPWGWVPYHYGRWSFVRNVGWCWVPPPVSATSYWCPGFVAWITGPDYVSWVPLAPKEVYYGYGYYGPNSVNMRTVNINRITINNTYVNARIRNGVTVINRQTFLTGRSERVINAPANPFAAGIRVTPGRPDIRPVKATALPDPVRMVSQRALPPERVAAKTALVERRPPAPNRSVSVFKPGERIRPMDVTRIEHPKEVSTARKPETVQPSVPRPSANGQEVNKPSVRSPGTFPIQKEEQARPPARKEEPVSPPAQRGEAVRAPAQSGQQTKPPALREQTARPPVQREQPATPSAPKQEMVRPSPQREQMAKPPVQREQPIRPPVAPREQTARPPVQREQPVAPPAPKQEMLKPSPQREQVPKPPVQREQPARPPVAPREQTVRPPAQRETGVAPRFGEQRSPANQPPRPQAVSPQQPKSAMPPMHREETVRPQVENKGRQ